MKILNRECAEFLVIDDDPAITKLLQQFGRPGVPLYVLYPAKNEEPIVFPEVLTKSMLLDKLETVARRVASQ